MVEEGSVIGRFDASKAGKHLGGFFRETSSNSFNVVAFLLGVAAGMDDLIVIHWDTGEVSRAVRP